MKQRYTKEQRKYAQKHKLSLICIGWNGEYQPKENERSQALFWGAVSPAVAKKVRSLLVEACGDRPVIETSRTKITAKSRTKKKKTTSTK